MKERERDALLIVPVLLLLIAVLVAIGISCLMTSNVVLHWFGWASLAIALVIGVLALVYDIDHPISEEEYLKLKGEKEKR